MKIMVCVKRVIDHHVNIQVKPDGSGVETNHVKMSINPFDEVAVEQAVQLREKGIAQEVSVVSIGNEKSVEVIRTALAMGADDGIHVKSNRTLQPLAIAKIIHALTNRHKPDVVLLGRQAIDDDASQVGQMLAGLLGSAQATFVSRLEWQSESKSFLATRETDSGLQTLKLNLPCVLTTDLRLNTPRKIALPMIMKARQKPIETFDTNSLSVDTDDRFEVIEVSEPAKRPPGVIVDSVAALLEQIKARTKGAA